VSTGALPVTRSSYLIGLGDASFELLAFLLGFVLDVSIRLASPSFGVSRLLNGIQRGGLSAQLASAPEPDQQSLALALAFSLWVSCVRIHDHHGSLNHHMMPMDP